MKRYSGPMIFYAQDFCQPFSIGGKRLGFGRMREEHYFYIPCILKEKESVVFLENVAGLCNHDGGVWQLILIISCLKEID